jgi:bacterioferritin (cytochrome b1)
MTRDEIIKHLTDELEDELEGICKYNTLYEALEGLQMHDEADRIERIASEEYYHAKILMDVLWMMNVDVSDHPKIKDDWAKVKRIFAIE